MKLFSKKTLIYQDRKKIKLFQFLGKAIVCCKKEANKKYSFYFGNQIQKIKEIKDEADFQKKISAYDRDVQIIFPPQGLGDILIVCALLKEYKKNHPNKKIVIWVTKRHFKELAELYSNYIFDIIHYNRRPNSADNVLNIDAIYRNTTLFNLCQKYKKLKNSIAEAMNISNSCELVYPEIEHINEPSISNTILIAPDAESTPKIISDSEWMTLAKMLCDSGYEVIFNCSNQNRFSGYQKVFWDIKQTVQKVDQMKAFISYRSGLADVIGAFCRHTHQFIIYPHKGLCNIGKFSNENEAITAYYNYCSIKDNFNDNLAHEYINSNNTWFNIVNDIQCHSIGDDNDKFSKIEKLSDDE
ncbi:MAG: glycosyltransferase family 9 protein [Akkermansiaceae bacterium]|nr:glycosyltransferase family 9 protein [Akkermansiaceae bacterium]